MIRHLLRSRNWQLALDSKLNVVAISAPQLDNAGTLPLSHSAAQLVEQRLCIFEVGGVETLGEPVVYFGEHRARLVATALRCEQSCEAHNRPQLQRLCPLRVRYVERLSEATLRSRPVGCPLHQQELALEPV